MAKTHAELIQEGKDITIHLTDAEKASLESCEQIIREGLNTFLEVGKALAEIHDNRLYKATHKAFPKYCKEVWGLGKTTAHQKMDGYRVVHLLKEKTSAIADVFETSLEEAQDENEDKCTDCGHREALAAKTKGVKIPGEPGKCIRPGGLCEKHNQPDHGTPQEIILRINESQTRPLAKLKNPDDLVKAWGIVLKKLNQDPKANLTEALIKKAVKEVQGTVVKRTIKKVKNVVKTTALVSTIFKKQYQVLLDIVVEEQNNGWTSMKKAEVIKHLKALIKIIESDE